MKKRVIGWTLGLVALVFMLSSTAWAAGDQAEYKPNSGTTQQGTFAAMWNLAAKNSGTVKLLQDVTADSSGSFGTGDGFLSNGIINVPADAKITLDLNGYTLDRGLTSAKQSGHVIQVSGKSCRLIIEDNSSEKTGTITGGNSTGNGGGIYVGSANAESTLFVNGVKITGNHAQKNGGGIYVSPKGILYFQAGASLYDNTAGGSGGGIYAGFGYDGKLAVSNSTISGNHAGGYGGGVYASCQYSDSVKFTGAVQIIDNTRTPSSGSEITDNVWIEFENNISFGTLSDPARIGIGKLVYADGVTESVIAATGATSENFQHLFADSSENHLVLNEQSKKISLLYGPGSHEHNGIQFSTALSTITSPLSAGNYYLTNDIDLSAGDTVEISGDVNLCLYGHKITGSTGKSAFTVPSGATLNIYNWEGNGFTGLSGSGGIQVDGGGTLKLMAADGSAEKTYQPDENTDGGNVTVDSSGAVTTPGGGGEDPTPAEPHEHNGITFATKLSTISSSLPAGSYYLTGDITLSDTVPISGTVNICLNGHTITGPTGKPAFQVPSGATLNIYNEEGTNGFAGLSGSGGIGVAGGGRLNLVAKNPADNVTYAPAAGSSGGKVTVEQSGTVTKPSEGGGEDPDPDGPHATRHPALADATAINAENFNTVTKAQKPSDYDGVLPEHPEAYRFLSQGKYYLENDFKMPYALIALGDTDFCLNGSNLGADNNTWLYEMQHVFWVPEKAALNVLDCQRDLHIIWLYGGRVFLKNGAKVNISGNVPGYITTIEMDEDADAEGEVQVKYVNGDPVMTLPKGAALTQKINNTTVQTIKNDGGVLEMTTPAAGGGTITTTVTPPGTGGSVDLKLPAAASGEETPNIVLEAPANSTVQTGENGPEIKLEQPGEVASDGAVSSPKVTVKTTDPVTREEVTTTVTAPAGKNVQVDAVGQAQAPEGSTVTVDNVAVKLEEIGGSDPDKTVPVSPSGEVVLPAGSEVTAGTSSKDGASIVIALPEDGGTLSITDNGVTPPPGSSVSAKTREDVTIVIALPNPGGGGQPGIGFGDRGSLILPPETKLTVKPKESVTIVIALPNPDDGGQPEVKFGGGGSLILPPGTKVTKDGKEETVTEGNNILDPESGDLKGPVNPNTPAGTPVEVTPGVPVDKPNVKVEMDADTGKITVTPKNPEDPAAPVTPVVIKPQTPAPGDPATPPKVDDDGKVFLDTPFTVETEGGPGITAEEGGSVDPDGSVTGKTVTVEQEKPDGTQSKTTLTAPEGDAIKTGPDGGAQAPVGTEVKKDNVTVKIDEVPDPAKPVPVKPDGGIDLPGGSKITVTPEQPRDPDQVYTVTIPEQGGEVKPNPGGKITLPPGAEVLGPDGEKKTISNNGGTLDPSTGDVTGEVPGGGDNPGGGGSGGGGGGGGSSSSASYIITASASIGGEISPDKQVTVRRGASQTFTIKPAEGYVISSVLVDGKSVGQVSSYTFSNVQSKHSIQALFVAEGMSGHGHQGDCPKNEVCPIWPYTDSNPKAWYHDGVHYCIEMDLMIGTAPALWEPDIPFTRAMMAQVLYNKSGRPAVSGDGMFDDVGQEWYWPAITWGGRNNVLFGYGDGNYGPQDPITREQLVALLWRYAGRPQTDAQSSFSDVDEVSDYAKQALHWASQQGIIAGYPDGAFHPRANATRAEAAQMIMRYFNL